MTQNPIPIVFGPFIQVGSYWVEMHLAWEYWRL